MGEAPAIALDQRLARAAARRLAPTPLTPNAVTATGLGVGLVGAGLIARGEVWSVNLGAVLFAFSVWTDHVDGELARMTGRTSRFGHYFDNVASLIVYVATFTAAGIGPAAAALDGWGALAGGAAGLSVAAIIAVRLWLERRAGAGAVRQTVRGGFEVEDTLYLVAPIAWFGGLPAFIVIAALGAPVFLTWTVAGAIRAARRTGPRP